MTPMEVRTMLNVAVKGMTCGHCVKAVTQAIKDVDGTADVDVDLGSGRVAVDSKLPAEAITQAIENAGYEVLEAQ